MTLNSTPAFSLADNAIPFGEVRRALVIKLRHHGDVLLTSPVFAALQAAAPGCEIDALVYADTAPLLEEHPHVAQLHRIDRQWKRLGLVGQASAEWTLLQTLRERHYDLVIHLTEHRRGAWLTRLLKPRWSVAPGKSGRGTFWRKSFTVVTPVPRNALRHTVERNLDALRALGLHPAPTLRKLVLNPGRTATEKIDALLAEQGLTPGGFIHLHPGSRWLFKCWPVDKVVGLIERLNAQGHALVLTAAPEARELAMIAAIKARTAAPLMDLSGQLTLRELGALTARARLFVGVDSAPMHIAAAVGTPVVVLFGPSGDKEWGPWQVAQQVITSEHSCRPCGYDGCGGSKVSDCLTSIPVARVFRACEELLNA